MTTERTVLACGCLWGMQDLSCCFHSVDIPDQHTLQSLLADELIHAGRRASPAPSSSEEDP